MVVIDFGRSSSASGGSGEIIVGKRYRLTSRIAGSKRSKRWWVVVICNVVTRATSAQIAMKNGLCPSRARHASVRAAAKFIPTNGLTAFRMYKILDMTLTAGLEAWQVNQARVTKAIWRLRRAAAWRAKG